MGVHKSKLVQIQIMYMKAQWCYLQYKASLVHHCQPNWLRKSKSFTKVANGFKPGLEAHSSTRIDIQSNHCAIRKKLASIVCLFKGRIAPLPDELNPYLHKDSIVNTIERLVISTILLTLCSIHDIVCSIYKTTWEYIKTN